MRKKAATNVLSAPRVERVREGTHIETTRMDEPSMRKIVPIIVIALTA